MNVKLGCYTILIRQDAMLNSPKEIWAWELPVYESKYPGGLVQIESACLHIRDKKPDVKEEAMRLQAMVVSDDNQFNHFQLAYGHGKAGLDALAAEIKRCTNPKDWSAPEQEDVSDEEIQAEIKALQEKLKARKAA